MNNNAFFCAQQKNKETNEKLSPHKQRTNKPL